MSTPRILIPWTLRGAGAPYLGVLPRGTLARRLRGPKWRRLGALRLLDHVREVDKWLE